MMYNYTFYISDVKTIHRRPAICGHCSLRRVSFHADAGARDFKSADSPPPKLSNLIEMYSYT